MFGVEEKGPGQCSAVQTISCKRYSVCEKEKKAFFFNKEGMYGEGSRHLALNRRKETDWRGRRATGQQHSPDGCQSDRIDHFIIWTLCTYFILSFLFIKTKIK